MILLTLLSAVLYEIYAAMLGPMAGCYHERNLWRARCYPARLEKFTSLEARRAVAATTAHTADSP